MKKFIKFSGVLFLLLLLFTGCLKDDNREPIYYFYDEPAVVNQTGDYPLIRNESYLFYVPELAGDTALKSGDLLWTSFIVDLDTQGNAESNAIPLHYTAKNFRYQTIDSSKVIIPADTAEFKSFLSDDYSASIELSVLYPYAIDSLWFFGFIQRDNSSNYSYEMILNPAIETVGSANYPTLYIRAKQTGVSATNSGKAYSQDGNRIFAFDVADFVKYYNDLNISTNQVRFNLKYKTGVDANGNDIYRSFRSNPISWVFSAVRPE